MQIVHHISESGSGTDQLFNAAHVFSSLNRKMIAPVDKKGNAQLFHMNIEVQSGSSQYVTVKTANTGYVTKQAVKAWFKVWRAKLREAGVSLKDLGPYGSVFKPRLQSTEDILGSGAEAGRGEWNYSDIVWTPPMKSTNNIYGNELSDQFILHICGDSVETNDPNLDTRQYDSVGMINSWLASRKKPAGADGGDGSEVQGDQTFDQDNPLHLVRGGNALSSELMLDEVIDLQKDEPPYTEADLDGLYTQAIIRSDANLSGIGAIAAPCGLVNITHSGACELLITLTGITDM